MLRYASITKPALTPAKRKGQIAELLAESDAIGKRALAEEIATLRVRQARKPKKQITLRLDVEVIEKFRATGDGWQARINAVLKLARL